MQVLSTTSFNIASKKNNNLAFKMKMVATNPNKVSGLLAEWIPAAKMEKILQDVLALKTKNGEEILVTARGKYENNKETIYFYAKSEGQDAFAHLSQDIHDTKKIDKTNDFLHLVEHLKNTLDNKISFIEKIKQQSDYYKNLFSK